MQASETQADPARDLGERLQRIRLPIAETARRASVHQATILLSLKSGRPMSDRVARDVLAAIEAEELELLSHLMRQHPDKARQLLAA